MAPDKRLYDILGLPKEATLPDIKKAYRLLALKHHPDKNNHSDESKAKFLEVCNAYEILSDERKRKLYDEYGTVDEISIQQQRQQQYGRQDASSSFFKPTGPMGMSAGDLFAQFFDNVGTPMTGFGGRKYNMPGWGAPPPSASRAMSRGPDIKHSLKCTLSELYYGKKTKLGLNRRRICKTCYGQGGLTKRQCKRCQGHGQITESRSMGPMVQTWTQTCTECNGSGSFMKSSDVCKDCQGDGCIRERKIFDVQVKRGMNDGQTIVLPGEADEIISTSYGNEKVLPGDVVITISLIKDKKFQRFNANGCDLLLRDCKISLSTSLCGGDIYIDGHPNNKLLKVSIIPGEIIKPNCFKSIENLGMPKYISGKDSLADETSEGFGNLYIQFQVEFPDKLEETTVQKLMAVLKDDANVLAQNASQDNTVYERLDDCVEMEDHVLSNFVPRFSDIKSSQGKTNGGATRYPRSSKKRRHYQDFQRFEDESNSDSAPEMSDLDSDGVQNCTIH